MPYMPSKSLLLAAALTLAGLAGCTENANPSSVKPAAASLGKPQHAECLVCKHENDLACLDVEVDPKTPTLVRDGKTYYFCSDECAKQFQKDPAKYIAGK